MERVNNLGEPKRAPHKSLILENYCTCVCMYEKLTTSQVAEQYSAHNMVKGRQNSVFEQYLVFLCDLRLELGQNNS